VITEDQSPVVDFLSSPSAHDGAPVERVETHASIVFLAGTRAWKLKRAVKYDYLDFSTIDRRRAMCEAEIRINRRIAPAIYRRAVPVTRQSDGSLAIGGSGSPVDWLVEMTRFEQSGLFDRLAEQHTLNLALMAPLAVAIARFHRGAEHRADHGGGAGMAWVVDGNAAGFGEQGADTLDAVACRELTRAAREHLAAHRHLLDTRRASGMVRQCHGDLHLRNIVLIDGQPTLFDAIEFNDEIACIDVLYDLGFLLMDLWHRRLCDHANRVWNAYLEETVDIAGIALLPLFLSCRAAIRAKTSATAANLHAGSADDLRTIAREYLALARALLQPEPAHLVAVGGFSGTGKSTLARSLAPRLGAAPGAVIVRSDDIRKRLCGVAPLQRLGPEGYLPDVTRRVYSAVAERTAQIIGQGHSAIVDAVHANPEDRETIEQIASQARVRFTGLWLDAPETTLLTRLKERRLDASDADAGVVQGQLDRGSGALTWRRIDASREAGDVMRQAEDVVRHPRE